MPELSSAPSAAPQASHAESAAGPDARRSAAPPAESASVRLRRRLGRVLAVAVPLAVVAAAAWAIHDATREYRYADLRSALAAMPPLRIVCCLLLGAGSYLALTGYDTLAGRYAETGLDWPRTALASFVSYSVGHNVGLGNLAGSSIRYRLYSSWGIPAASIARVILFCAAGFWLGLLSLAAVVFLFAPESLPATGPLALLGHTHAVGGVAAAIVASAFGLSFVVKKPLDVEGMQVRFPSPGLLAAQACVGMVDWILAGSALYAVMPDSLDVSWASFLGLYLLASLAGLISHVPGGLGVLESAMLLLLAGKGAAASEVLAAILVFRFCYYLVPLGAGSVLLLVKETPRGRAAIGSALAPALQGLATVAAPLLAVGTFAGGVALLVAGAAPPMRGRFGLLAGVVPLPLIETAHFAASIAGTLALLVAHSLQRRLDAARRVGIPVLAVGALSAALGGGHFELSVFLLVLLGGLSLGRNSFYRKAALLREPLTAAWAAAVLAAGVTALALGFLAFETVRYRHDLWWEFALQGHAPRWMRASVGMSMVLAVFGALRLMRPARVEPGMPSSQDMDDARKVLATVDSTVGNLALLGDKALLFNEERTAFLMYGVSGRSWVVMGDPVGPEDEWSDLLWDFQAMAADHSARCVFYEVGARRLDLYLDLGLSLFKIGEEASVELASFSMEGKDSAEFRRVQRNLTRDGYTFRIAEPSEVAMRMQEMREVSDEWLGGRHVAEKGFSLGFFDEASLARTPCALVEKDGRICAFANLWLGGTGRDLTVDLMRHRSDAPNGLMDFLFTSLMLWGRAQGYASFSLGMAPLAGLDDHAPGSIWSLAGRFVYRYADHFYNFEGLRRYKDKFGPSWSPRYVACSSAWQLPQALADVTSLVSGSLRKAVTR